MRYKLKLIFLILAFFIGVFSGSQMLFGFFILVCFGGFIFALYHNARFVVFVVFMFLFGLLRFYFSFFQNDPGELVFFNDLDQEVSLHGIVSEEPDVRSSAIKLTVSVETLEVSGNSIPVFGRVLVDTWRYPEYFYGDRLEVTGKVVSPKDSPDFSYKNYLSRYGIGSLMYDPYIVLISREGGSFFYRWIYWFKGKFSDRMNEIFSEPSASFLAGLLLGSRKGISADIMNDFATTGLTHIIAISGYNITLLIVIVTFLFGFLSRRLQVLCASFVIIVFTILVGASAACVRASLMGIISLFALFWGRKGDLDLVLLFAAFFMTLWNPKIFVFDVGFQLSFLATMGLVYISPLLTDCRAFKILPNFFGIRESFLMTISAQITTLPIILYNFQRFSVVAPFANVLILPLIPLSMFFGFFSVFAGSVFEPFGLFLSYIALFFLGLIVKIAHFFAILPFASYDISWFSESLFVLYCLFVGILLIKAYVFRSRISK